MDTLNNMATAAAKVVWGDGEANKEPISGAKGDVSKGQPYDAGNLDPQDQLKVESAMNGGYDTPPVAKPSAPDNTAARGDTRDTEDEDAQVELKGPGPRPLNEVAKEHGGDAGKDIGSDSNANNSSSPNELNEVDNADDAENKGTGEKYIKTTGLAADGGDFDATKPGAGREADRLMDEKGMRRDEDNDNHNTGSHGHHKDKPSLGERIKAKLHRH